MAVAGCKKVVEDNTVKGAKAAKGNAAEGEGITAGGDKGQKGSVLAGEAKKFRAAFLKEPNREEGARSTWNC